MKTRILIIIGIALILVIGLVLIYQVTQMQNQLSILNELKTELEAPNVTILTYSWQDTPYFGNYSLFKMNCTIFNTGLKTALGTYLVMFFYFVQNVPPERNLLSQINIQGRQSYTYINFLLVHNFTVGRISLEPAWGDRNPI